MIFKDFDTYNLFDAIKTLSRDSCTQNEIDIFCAYVQNIIGAINPTQKEFDKAIKTALAKTRIKELDKLTRNAMTTILKYFWIYGDYIKKEL